MTRHREERMMRTPRDVLFDIVADVERYPEFLPMWRQVRIRQRRGNTYYTDQEIGLGPIRERFMTRTVLAPPEAIEITSDDRMFRRFLIRWWFHDLGEACRVEVELDWRTRSFVLQRAIDVLLGETARSMVRAFETRALELSD